MPTTQSWILTPPPIVSNQTIPVKPSPHWFLPFPLSGNYEAISSQTAQKQDGTKQNTYRSLTTSQSFVLTELATSGCCGHHFLGEGHQLRWGQLRGFLGVRNKKSERSICHQALLSHSWVLAIRTPQDPLLVSEDMKSAYLFHPHGIWTKFCGAFTPATTPFTYMIPTSHSG